MNHHKKIAPKQEGPFGIEEVLGPVTYQLKILTTWKIHKVFHATLLRPYIENKIYENNYPRQLPEEKKYTKWKQSSNINEEKEDINTM